MTFNEYRSLMQGNEPYKRYLQNVFTSNTVLFLGFSLSDPDLESLLDGLRYHLGDDMARHYALLDTTRVTAIEIDHFRDNYGIQVIGYRPSAPSHPEVGNFLNELISCIPPKAARLRKQAQEETDKIDPHYTLVPTGRNEFGIFEKYAGAAKEKPLKTSFTLKVDKSEEGQAARQAIDDLFETGETVSFKPEQVIDWKLPDLIFQATGIMLSEVQIVAGTSRSGRKLKVNLIHTTANGITQNLNGIELECLAAGNKRVRWSNEEQDSPWKIELVVETSENTLTIHIEFNPTPSNVVQMQRNWQFGTALSEGGQLIVEEADTGLNIEEMPIEKGVFPMPSPDFLQILDSLAFISRKTKTPITLPNKLYAAQLNVIEATERVLRTGKIDGAFTIAITIRTDFFRELLNNKENEIVFEHYQSDHSTVIFGERIFFGTFWLEVLKLNFTPEELIIWREKLEKITDAEINLKFNFAPSAEATLYFLEWLAPKENKALRQNAGLRSQAARAIIRSLFYAAKIEGDQFDKDLLKTYLQAALDEPSNRQSFVLGDFTDEEFKEAVKSVIEKTISKEQSKDIEELIEELRFG